MKNQENKFPDITSRHDRSLDENSNTFHPLNDEVFEEQDFDDANKNLLERKHPYPKPQNSTNELGNLSYDSKPNDQYMGLGQQSQKQRQLQQQIQQVAVASNSGLKLDTNISLTKKLSNNQVQRQNDNALRVIQQQFQNAQPAGSTSLNQGQTPIPPVETLLKSFDARAHEALVVERPANEKKDKVLQKIENFLKDEGNTMAKQNKEDDQKFSQPTVKYGDIITITMDKNYTPGHAGDEEDESSQLNFRGIIYCNGVTKLSLDMISRNFHEKPQAFCNFRNCLFRIDACSHFEINQKVSKLMLKRQRFEVQLEIQDDSAKIQDEISNEKTPEQEIEELNKKISAFQEALELENQDNEYLNKKNKGSKVLYGDLILLKHLESGRYLSLNPKVASDENGCVACQLMTLSDSCLMSIAPSDRLRQNGQIILYQDSLLFQNYIEPSANKQAQFLHVNTFKLQKKMQKAILEVNGSSDITVFKARLYQPYSFMEDIEDAEENVISGSVVRFYHKQTNGFLSVKMPHIFRSLPAYPDFLYTEITNFAEEEAGIKQKAMTYQRIMEAQLKAQSEVQGILTPNGMSPPTHPSFSPADLQQLTKYDSKIVQIPRLELLQESSNQMEQQKELSLKKDFAAGSDIMANTQINHEITIEQDALEKDKSKYLWEIQRLKPFQASQIQFGLYYRIKHVQSGFYLRTLNPQDEQQNDDNKESSKQLLSLDKLEDKIDFLFRIKKDTKTSEEQVDFVKHQNLIYLESAQQLVIQSATKKKQGQTTSNLEGRKGIFKTQDVVSGSTFEEVVCSQKPVENHSKMVFTIQIAAQNQAELVKVTNNQCDAAQDYFEFLNSYAVDKYKSETEIRRFGGMRKFYSDTLAREEEVELQKETQQFRQNIIDLRQKLKYLDQKDEETYTLFQNYLAEQGVLEIYIKLLELIIHKTVPNDERYKYSRYKRYFEVVYPPKKQGQDQSLNESLENPQTADMGGSHGLNGVLKMIGSRTVAQNLLTQPQQSMQNNFMRTANKIFRQQSTQESIQNAIKADIQLNAYQISYNLIADISAEILQTVVLMIKGNQKPDTLLDQFPSILFSQLLGEHIKKASKIFKVSYSLSRLGDIQGDFLSYKDLSDKKLLNQQNLARWIDLIFDPQYISEENQNLKQQVIFLKVISLICQDDDGNGIFENQMLIYKKLLKENSRLRTIVFGIRDDPENPGQKYPHVQFTLKGDYNSDQNEFFSQNPHLADLVQYEDRDSEFNHNGLRVTPPISLLKIFDSSEKYYIGYTKFFCSYLDMIITCVKNGHKHATTYPKEIGLSFDFARTLFEQTSEIKLQVLLIKFLTAQYVDNNAAYGVAGFKNRCYYWSLITPQEMHHKNLQLSPDSHYPQSLEETQEMKRMKQLWDQERKDVYKWLPSQIETTLLLEHTYEYNKIDASALVEEEPLEIQLKDRQKMLKLIISSLECAICLIKCEKSSPVLAFKIIYASAIIFSQFSPNHSERFSAHGLYDLIVKSFNILECKELVEKIYMLLLQTLVIICKKRTDYQIMTALKSFKFKEDYLEEENALQDLQIEKGLKKKQKEERKREKQWKRDQFRKFQESIAQLFNLEANGRAVLDEMFIQGIEDTVLKQECQKLNSMFMDDEHNQHQNVHFNLKKQLLFLIFDKRLDDEQKNLAFEVLMLNFEMVNTFSTELSKVQIITEDQKSEYSELQMERKKIVENLQDIVWFSFKEDLKGKQEWQESVNNVIASIKKISEGLSQSNQKQKLRQDLIRYLEIPRLLIDQIMKDVRYNKDMHLELFGEIMNFLFLYSLKNEENSQTLTSQLDYLSTLPDIQNEKLITQIVKQLKSQEKETQLIDHIMKHISKNNLQDSANLLKSLNSLADVSIFNKGNIFKKILKSTVYRYLFLRNEDEQANITVIVKNYKVVAAHLKSLENQKQQQPNEQFLQAQSLYHIHKSLISLLIQCSNDQANSVPQIAKIAPYDKMNKLIGSHSTPFLLRKKYLRLHLQIHLTQYEDVHTSINLKHDPFVKKLFEKVVCEDLREFPFYVMTLIKQMGEGENWSEQMLADYQSFQSQLQGEVAQLEKMREEERRSKELAKLEKEKSEKQKRRSSMLLNQSTDQKQAIKLINDQDPGEYWRYLSYFSNTLNKQDGLLHFITDFFNDIKWQMSKVFVQVVKDRVLANLQKMLEMLSAFNSKNSDMVNADTYISALEDAVKAVNGALDRNIELQMKSQKNKQQHTRTSMIVSSSKKKQQMTLQQEYLLSGRLADTVDPDSAALPKKSKVLGASNSFTTDSVTVGNGPKEMRSSAAGFNFKKQTGADRFKNNLEDDDQDDRNVINDLSSHGTQPNNSHNQSANFNPFNDTPQPFLPGGNLVVRKDKSGSHRREGSIAPLVGELGADEQTQIQTLFRNSNDMKSTIAPGGAPPSMSLEKGLSQRLGFLGQIPDNSEIITDRYFAILCKDLLAKPRALGEVFQLKEYDSMTQITQKQFVDPLKPILSLHVKTDKKADFGKPRDFYKAVLDMIVEKQQDQQEFDRDDANSQGKIQFALFADLLSDFVKNQLDSYFSQPQKQDLQKIIRTNQVNEQAAHQAMQDKLNKFTKKILEKSEILNSKKDLQQIIDVIADSFDFKKASNEQINAFFVNMMSGLQLTNQRVYILKVLVGILLKYEKNEKNLDVELQTMRDNIKNFQIILHIMEECKFPETLIRFLDTNEDEEVSMLSIQMLIILLEGLREKIQNQLYEFIREKQDELKVAEYLRIKIEYFTPIVIQQSFNLLRERNLQYMRVSKPDEDQYLEVADESKSKLMEIQRLRKKTISKFTNILRLIQLLCDNCHRGFQDYFRDQITIQQNYAKTEYQEQLAQDTIESTSSFNMIVIVVRSFMRITEELRELIYFDAEHVVNSDPNNQDMEDAIEFGVAGLMGQFIETMIDFLYGPCEENQFLLSGWRVFLKTLDFYMNCEHAYYFAQTVPQEAHFMIMEKISLLLLGLVETPNDKISREIAHSLQAGISFGNLQRVMVDIHKQKIQAYPGSYDMFKSRRKYQPSRYDIMDSRIYPEGAMRASDERIFEIGFNIFKFLITCKRLIPEIQQLPSTDSTLFRSKKKNLKRMYNDEIKEMKSETHLMRLLKEKLNQSQVTLAFLRKQIIFLFNQNDDKIRKNLSKYARIIEFLKKKKKYFDQQDESVMKVNMNIQTKNFIKLSLFRGLVAQRKSSKVEDETSSQFGKFFSAIRAELKNGTDQITQMSKKLTSKISSFGKSVSANTSTSKKEVVNVKEFKKQMKDSDDENEDIVGPKYQKYAQRKVDEFNENQEDNETYEQRNMKQDFENYKITLAFQFYSQYIATVEVDYKGTLVRAIFRIPSKCSYLSKKSREEILYGQLTSSLFDKLETIFSHMNILIAEMKSNQRLSRKSLIRHLMSEYNFALQTLSSLVVLVINMMYLIFYDYNPGQMNDDGTTSDGKIEFSNDIAYYVALTLQFIQAAISGLIHIGYFDRFHGVYYQKHFERRRQEHTVQFTKFKGSLGFATGMTATKESRSIVETEMHNLREKFNSKKRKNNKSLYYVKSLWYAFKMYFVGLNTDPVHIFNLFYFGFSIGAIYQPFLFSLLLLENILQIPLLYNVIQAIINNRKQILLTLLLLFGIVYVYAFIAFMTFRGDYSSDGTTPFNGYCENLGYCFTSTLNNGVRSGGGIGDAIHQIPIEDDLYWARYVFDITFFIMIIVLMLNLIFGIIIDAFAAMRDMRNEVEREVKEKCFICGKSQSIFESKKKSFQDHIQREHNVYAYIYFILYLTRKPTFECTGVERHVQQLISQEDPTFFPIDRALALEDLEGEVKKNDDDVEN